MKITIKILSLLLMMAFAMSCSKDEKDPEPDLDKVSISLAENAQVITVPTAMANSEDPYAQQASSYITLANSVSANFALFKAPANATKSTTEITPVNGRVNASAKVVVYTWTDPSYGSVAYQVKDAGTKYTFEFFVKPQGETGWYRYLHAEEEKDHSTGNMIVYDYFSKSNDILLQWDWTKSGDDFKMNMTSSLDSDVFKVTIAINTKTKAGSVVYFQNALKLYDMTWDAQGSGTWNFYENGVVTDSGTW
jgi:hypothetical protein